MWWRLSVCYQKLSHFALALASAGRTLRSARRPIGVHALILSTHERANELSSMQSLRLAEVDLSKGGCDLVLPLLLLLLQALHTKPKYSVSMKDGEEQE